MLDYWFKQLSTGAKLWSESLGCCSLFVQSFSPQYHLMLMLLLLFCRLLTIR